MHQPLNLFLLTSAIWLPCILCDHTNQTNQSLTNYHLQNQPCDQQTSTRYYLLAIFSGTVVIVGILGNALTIFLIQISSQLRQQIAYIFVTSLAVADLGVSTFVTTVKVGYYIHNGGFCYGYALCVFFHLTDSFFPITSISNLVVIGLDRWYAIACPYNYIKNMTIPRAKCAIVCVWLYSALWSLLGIFSWAHPSEIAYKIRTVGRHRYCYSLNKYYHTMTVSVIYILPITVTSGLYVIVLYIALKQAATISRSAMLDRPSRKRRLYDMKAAKTVAAVFLAYTVCWLPHIAIILIHYWKPRLLQRFYHYDEVMYDVMTTTISNILPTLNSCLNPFIYFLSSSQFRLAFADVVYRRILHCPRKHDGTHDTRLNSSRSVSSSGTTSMGRFSLTSVGEFFMKNNSEHAHMMWEDTAL